MGGEAEGGGLEDREEGSAVPSSGQALALRPWTLSAEGIAFNEEDMGMGKKDVLGMPGLGGGTELGWIHQVITVNLQN